MLRRQKARVFNNFQNYFLQWSQKDKFERFALRQNYNWWKSALHCFALPRTAWYFLALRFHDWTSFIILYLPSVKNDQWEKSVLSFFLFVAEKTGISLFEKISSRQMFRNYFCNIRFGSPNFLWKLCFSETKLLAKTFKLPLLVTFVCQRFSVAVNVFFRECLARFAPSCTDDHLF